MRGLTIAFHDPPGGLQGVDFAKEPPLRSQEPTPVHRRHPSQLASKASEIVSGDFPNRESLSCLASHGTAESKPIRAKILLREPLLLQRSKSGRKLPYFSNMVLRKAMLAPKGALSSTPSWSPR